MSLHFFFFAGEPSADLYGSALIQFLKGKVDHLKLSGVGGPLMRAEGVKGQLQMEQLQVMGFSDVLKALPRLYRYFRQTLKLVLTLQPDVVILIDYPGFNLRLAKALRKNGYQGKIVQYISPSVWAHGKGRIQTLAQTVDLLLTIYPFEKALFSQYPLKVEYVGHPLMQTIADWQRTIKEKLDHKEICQQPYMALFPGSRLSEIKRHFPFLLKIAQAFKKKAPAWQFVCCYVDSSHLSLMQKLAKKHSFPMQDLLFVSSHQRYQVMQKASLALAKSGSVTLELALLKVPTVVIYQLSALNFLIAKYFLRLRLSHYCIVNIIAKKEIFPEFIGISLSFKHVLEKLEQLYKNQELTKKMQQQCQELKALLTFANSHKLAAKAIMRLFV